MLMKESDAIIQAYGLSVLPSKPKKQNTKPMSDREYRSADKGQSWKLNLAIAIDDAMRLARSKEHFIELMAMEGYGVKWTDERKYITYTTPDGLKCRDNKLHEEKYLKGRMEHEFRIRKKIYERIERSGQATVAGGIESRSMRGSYRTELESDDRYAGQSDQTVGGNTGWDSCTGDKERDRELSESTDETAERVFRGEQNNHREVPDNDGEPVGKISFTDQNDSDGSRETGWEYERSIFESAFNGAESDAEIYEAAVSDLTDPLVAPDRSGTDIAYLAADFLNVLDNDHPVEDCTTIYRPHEQEKKKNHGPVMGGM